MELKGKVAIVTGSSRGLGKAIAIKLAEAGADILVNYKANAEKARMTVEAILHIGGQAAAFRADVTSEDETRKMFEFVLSKFGKLDILVNNAGISKDAVSWKMPIDVWDEVIKTNLYGPFICTKFALEHMRKQQTGRIINVVSVVGQVGLAGTSAYAASKAGLIGFTKSVAKEVVLSGITVNALGLGYFNEGIMLTLPSHIQDTILSQIPMRKLGTPDSLGEVVVFLCSEAAYYITGQVINVNGGYYM